LINGLKDKNKSKTLSTLDLKLIFIIIFALGFILSIFLIIKDRVFLTRYEQLFLSDFISFLENPEVLLVGFINNFPMLTGFYTLFSNITSIESTKILIFPFGFILFPLTIYFFVSTFNKNFNKNALFGALYFFVYYFYTKYLQVGYVGALTIPIVLLFIGQMVRIFKKKNIMQNITLGILELIYLVGIWHSAGFYAIALLGGIVGVYLLACLIQVIIMKLRKDNIVETNFLKPKIAIILFIGIIFIGSLILNVKEDLLLQYIELFKNRFLGGGFIENIKNVFTPIYNRLFNRSDYPLSETSFEYSYTSLTSGKIYFIVHTLLHIFSVFLLIIGLITMIIRTRRNKDKGFLKWIIFGFSLLLAQFIFYILYSATGVNLFFIAIIFPIVGVYFTRKLGWKKFSAISMGLFLGFATIMSVCSIASDQFSNNTGSTFEDNIYGFEWLANNTNSNSKVILDFNIYGRYLQYTVENNITIDYIVYYLDSTNYSFLTGINDPPQNYDSSWYFVFDIQTMNNRVAFDIYEKRGLLISRLDLININPNLALVYNDGIIGIYNYRLIEV